MSTITFNVGGKVMTADQIEAQAPPIKPRQSADPEPFFKGLRVFGHPPGHIAECERLQNEAHVAWVRMDGAQLKQAKLAGRKDPGPFILESWLRKHPGRRIERPYELRSAAETCAELARKAGWEYVRIEAWERQK